MSSINPLNLINSKDLTSTKEIDGHQKKSAATRKAKDPDAFRKMGMKGAEARHNKSQGEESAIAKRAAAKRKERDPDTFRKMGKQGGVAPHVSRGRAARLKENRNVPYVNSRGASNDMALTQQNKSTNTNLRQRYEEQSIKRFSISSKPANSIMDGSKTKIGSPRNRDES